MFFELPQSSIKGWISNHQGRVQETREAKDRASYCCHRLAQVTPQNLSFRIPFFFFFFWRHPATCRILVPGPVTELGSLQWKRRVLTTGPPEGSWGSIFLHHLLQNPSLPLLWMPLPLCPHPGVSPPAPERLLLPLPALPLTARRFQANHFVEGPSSGFV